MPYTFLYRLSPMPNERLKIYGGEKERNGLSIKANNPRQLDKIVVTHKGAAIQLIRESVYEIRGSFWVFDPAAGAHNAWANRPWVVYASAHVSVNALSIMRAVCTCRANMERKRDREVSLKRM